MTPQEREVLTDFLQQLAQTRADSKDAEAEGLIRSAMSRQPDADYLLVQRAMGLDLALKAAQAQIAKLEAGSWGRSAPAATPARPAAPATPAAAAAPPSAWGSGMLGNLATTAAGVVAGSFLYQGIQNMLGHHTAANDHKDTVAQQDTLAQDEPAQALDESDDSVALDDGGFDSPDLG
jgi:hypothetical protein